MADDSRWRPGKPLRIIPIGDVATASEWIPFARRKMVELSRSGDYARRTWMPAPGVIIRGETLRGIPRVFIEVEGYEYITVSWYNQELHAGDFGLENTSKKVLDFPHSLAQPSGFNISIGPNLMHIGGNQFATGPAPGFGAKQIAIVSVSGKSAAVKYLPRWRSVEDAGETIVTLQYGGKTTEGAKRIEYFSTYTYAMNQATYPYEVSLYPTDTFWTQMFVSTINMYAYSSTTPLGSSVSIDSGTLVEDALANPTPVDPVFWIVNAASAGGDKTTYIPVGDSPPLHTSVDDVVVGVPGTPAPDGAYYTQWNWRRELELGVTATTEVDADPLDPSINLYTTVFVLRFIENIQVLSWDGTEGRDESDNPMYVPGNESATIVSGAAGAAELPGGVSFDWVIPPNPATGSPGGTYTPWSVASTAGVYRSQRRHMVETSAKIISAATENLGGGRIAILLLTERGNALYSGGPWGSWSVDNVGPYATGQSYLFNMVTITSSDHGQSWHAKITRRTIGVSPFPERLQFLNTLLYVGDNTLLAFGSMYTGLTVWRSTDAGTSYSMLVPPGGIPAIPAAGMAICLAPGVAGFFSAGKFYRSTDSGATWTTYTIPTSVMSAPWNTFQARIAVRAIGETYATTKLAIVVSTSNAPNTSKIFLSDDGGETWRVDSTLGKKPYPQDQAIGVNIGVLNTGLPPNPGLPGMYDEPPL